MPADFCVEAGNFKNIKQAETWKLKYVEEQKNCLRLHADRLADTKIKPDKCFTPSYHNLGSFFLHSKYKLPGTIVHARKILNISY